MLDLENSGTKIRGGWGATVLWLESGSLLGGPSRKEKESESWMDRP